MSARVAESAGRRLAPPRGGAVTYEVAFKRAFSVYERSFDHEYGGRRMSPKFSGQLPIRFLLRHHVRSGEESAIDMADLTLRAMAKGGVYDQIGGGFHRYSTDPSWRVPHFEKMLYHNARLVMTYLEAHQVTGDREFARIAREILTFMERELSSADGGFFAAIDADSRSADGQRAEGWYYTWHADELRSALSASELDWVRAYFALNVTGDIGDRSVLYRDDWHEPDATFDEVRKKLYQVRSQRLPPFVDRKIVTGWNALAISAFAHASRVFSDSRFLGPASKAAAAILDASDEAGRLRRMMVDGTAVGGAFADDYALFIQALIDLYQASGRLEWLQHAIRLQTVMDEDFADADGAFFYSTSASDTPLAREKPTFDGSLPSANSTAVLNLLRLHELTSDDVYRQRAQSLIAYLDRALAVSAEALPDLLLGLDFLTSEPKAVVIVTPSSREDAKPFLEILGSTFVPNHVVAVVSEGEELERHGELIPLVRHKYARDGKTTAYVCVHGVCDLPTNDPAVFAGQIVE